MNLRNLLICQIFNYAPTCKCVCFHLEKYYLILSVEKSKGDKVSPYKIPAIIYISYG